MEADEYFSTYDALHEDGVPPGRLTIREKFPSGITKIVWSSFDFMTGPELKFVWETNPSSMSPANHSGEEGSINDVESLDSSLSTQSAQYEDIDDPLETELETTEMFDSMMLSDSAYGFFTSSPLPKYGAEHYLGDFMTESRSTTTLTCSTVGMNDSRFGSEATTSRLFSPQIIEENDVDEQGNYVGTMTENPCITQLDLANLSSPDLQQTKRDTVFESGDSDTLTDGSSFVKVTDGVEGKDEVKKLQEQVLTNSCVDSGIGGTISMHSDLSALCQSPIYPVRDSRSSNQLGRDSPDIDDLTSVLDMSLDVPEEPISDEYFIAKFVLAEQICTTQLPSNPLMHKLTIVPTRGLLSSSYIFSAEGKDGRKTIHAISFLLSSSRTEWFMQRQNFFETLLTDSVPRLKASLYTETFDDVIVRATLELARLLDLVGCLERFPLVSESRPLMLKHTLFAGRQCETDKILPKVLSGVLQSQGYCVVVGSDQLYVTRLLYTLALFLPEELRWCGVRTYRHHYSPYIRLQAVRRSELAHVVRFGTMSTWPICVVDVDQGTVCMSASYPRHRVLRQRAELERLEGLLELRSHPRDRASKLELSSCKVLDSIKKLLHHMDMLPYEESVRIGLVQQLLLYVENMALAFIGYVKETSLPLQTEKTNPAKSSRFSLSDCRRALDLQSDSWFHAVLAKADNIHPDIADFVCS